MIVSPGRRYVFVHIPKTGGTSLALALEARAMRDDILIGDTPKALARRRRLAGLEARGRLWKHSRLSDIEGIVAPEALEAMLVFTLVRNPWDRVASYYHWLRVQRFDHPAVALARALPFGAFLRHESTRAALAADRAGAYVSGSDGAERPAVFVRLEHFAEDIAPVERHLGFALRPARANASLRARDHRVYYDAESAAIVEHLFAEDIARFGYAF